MRALLLCLPLLLTGCAVGVTTTLAKPEVKVYDREDFKKLVLGKTKQEVLDLLGKPDTTGQAGSSDSWSYLKRTRDSVTGKVDGRTVLLIRDDKVHDVIY